MGLVSPAMKKYLDASAFYLSNMEASGLSPRTVSIVASRIELFRQFWEERISRVHRLQEDPGVADMMAWKTELTKAGLTTSTVAQYLGTVRAMFDFVSDESMGDARFYERNPVPDKIIPSARKEKKRPYDQILTGEEVAKLWNFEQPMDRRRNHYWARNYAIVVTILASGLRNNEVLSLRPCDINWEYGELVVEHGKGDKFRMVDFPEIAQTAVRLYLESGLRPEYLTDDDYLFGVQSTKGQWATNAKCEGAWNKGSSQWLSQIIKNHVYHVTGVESVTSHDLRHVAARLDLNNGMSAEELQSKLGHSSVKTTQIYSGRILARRKRMADIAAYDERDMQVRQNKVILENHQQGTPLFRV